MGSRRGHASIPERFAPASPFLHSRRGSVLAKGEHAMDLRHILAATDESDAGREAVRVAHNLRSRASARVTVLRVMAAEATRQLVGTASGVGPDDDARDEPALRHLHRWLEADVLLPSAIQDVELATAAGVPGIEICRFAERVQADLLVLGRKR